MFCMLSEKPSENTHPQINLACSKEAVHTQPLLSSYNSASDAELYREYVEDYATTVLLLSIMFSLKDL